jgi:hypothetical protein
MKLRARALGLAVGVLMGVVYFVAVLYSLWFGNGQKIFYFIWYPGYDRTYLGAIIGLIGGFIEGFIIGSVVALLYNFFHKKIYKTDAAG